jgi:type I restriction enzyme, S subunit
MSRYKAYPAYKDSGVEWLGEIPANWEAKRLSHFFEERRKKVSDEDYPALSVTRQGIVPQLETAAKTDAGDNRKLVLKDDFVINSRSDRKGSSGVSSYNGSVSLISIVMTPRGIHPPFTHHLLRSYPFQEEFYRYGKGIVADLWSTNVSEMKNILIPDVPISEQEKIADFLDHETAKIDALIEKQKRLIELLKEKRQAVISHAVTKGLNPNAPMKDSGVEWLGEVPAHWVVAPLKRFAEVIDCKHYTVQFLDEGLPIVSIRELRDDLIDLANAKMTSRAEWDFLREGRVPRTGDIVFCRNASVGAAGYVDGDAEFCMGQDVCLIRTGNANRYMHFQITSRHVREQIEAFLVGATIRRANVEEIRRLVVAQPPETEQIKIAKYLENTLSEFDALSDKANRTVELLQERRTALISAAVTGKIDVRDWQPAAAQEEVGIGC